MCIRPDSRTAVPHVAGERRLQRVIRGVRVVHHHVLDSKSTDEIPALSNTCSVGKFRRRAGIRVRVSKPRKVLRGGAYVRGICRQVSEFALEAEGPGEEPSVAEARIDTAQVERRNGARFCHRSKIPLISVYIHDRVRRNRLGGCWLRRCWCRREYRRWAAARK